MILQSYAVCHADFKNRILFAYHCVLEVTAHRSLGRKGMKRKEMEEESGKERELGEMMKRWKEDKIKEQERGRGDGIKMRKGR